MANSAIPSVSVKQFLSELWSAAPAGFAELHLSKPNPKDPKAADVHHPWFYKFPDDIDRLIAHAEKENGTWNVYFGTAIRSRMRGHNEDVLAVTAFTCDVDFKATPEAKARKLLHEFPVKPSAVLRTGGGIHVYWFLKEAITGDDLKHVRPIELAIAAALGGDKRACTLKQILRVPNCANVKPAYPDPKPVVTVTWFKPEHRYNLSNFDFLPKEEAKAEPAAGETPRAAPSAGLLPESITKMSELLTNLWTKGWRHQMALDVAGMLAHAGVGLESAKAVVAGVSSAVGGQTEARVKDVEDTYQNFAAGKEIAGATSIEKMIVEEWPEAARPQARKTLNEIRKLLPKSPKQLDKKRIEPDFEIKKIVKFDSRPARYHLTISHKGSAHEITCETNVFGSFRDFRIAFMEATRNHWLANVGQEKWEEMTSDADLDVKPAPPEATPSGNVETALERFLIEAKERPKVGELKSFAGFDEETSYFQLPTFKAFLRDQGIKASEQLVCDRLRGLGWEGSIVRRFGDKTARVWTKPVNHNGHAEPELFKVPDVPKQAGGVL